MVRCKPWATEKQCGKCEVIKPRSEYYTDARGWIRSGSCKRCEQARRSARPNNRDPEHKHNYWLKRNYGITLADYHVMLAKQNGACAVCGATKNSRKRRWFDVDHNHTTGEVRGLLCSECNHGIGAMRDDPTLLMNALVYLSRYGWGRLKVA